MSNDPARDLPRQAPHRREHKSSRRKGLNDYLARREWSVEAAKHLCRSCPLQEACLAGALERSEPWGVWGGQLFEQGVVVPRKRPRGRPRKNEVA